MSRDGAWDFEPLQHVCCRDHVEQTPGYGRAVVRCVDCHRPGIRTFNPVHVTWEDEIPPAAERRAPFDPATWTAQERLCYALGYAHADNGAESLIEDDAPEEPR